MEICCGTPRYNAETKSREATVQPAGSGRALPSDFYSEYKGVPWEAVADISPTDRLHVRVGRQFISWGETDGQRLLDVINPQNLTFSPPAAVNLFNLDETRVPQWGLRMLYTASPVSNTILEFFANPDFEEKKNRADEFAPTNDISDGNADGDLRYGRWSSYPETRMPVARLFANPLGPVPVVVPSVIDRAGEFIEKTPLAGAQFKLASGYAGVLAAANEVIARSDKLTLGLMLLAQLVFCALGFRSLVAGLLFVGVVLMSNAFGMALMAYWNVGLNVNTLPVISLGIGFGEDYGIYIVSRAIEEYQRQNRGDLNRALIEGVTTAGKAVLYTAFLISVSIAFWALSPLRFQAEMGTQLLIILTMNMLGGLLLLPALIAWLTPKFVVRPAKP